MIANQSAVFSSWSPRLALFAGALICMGVLMHRLLGMPTPLALNLFAVAFGLSALAIALGMIALIDVWRRGVQGFAWALIGILVAASTFLWPLAYVQNYLDLPKLNDVTTDVTTPPPFLALAKLRVGSANRAAYNGAALARRQIASYPDIRALRVDRTPEDAYEVALETIKRLKYKIVSEAPPRNGRPGLIESVDRTLVIGFYDDVVVRVTPDRGRTRIDVRTASRYGSHDFGRNAARMRRLLTELQARIDASVPAGGRRISRAGSREKKAKAELNRRKAGSRSSRDRRRSRGSSR